MTIDERDADLMEMEVVTETDSIEKQACIYIDEIFCKFFQNEIKEEIGKMGATKREMQSGRLRSKSTVADLKNLLELMPPED